MPKPQLPRFLIVFWRQVLKRFPILRIHKVRFGILAAAGVILAADIITAFNPFFAEQAYALGPAESLLTPISQPMADKLKHDQKQQTFSFNNGQTPPIKDQLSNNSAAIAATAYEDPKKGVTVSDTTNKIDFSLTPKFDLGAGKKDGNRIVYPLRDGRGWAVYTMEGAGVKEDIVLNSTDSDKKTFEYTLKLGDSLEARLEADGSIGVYGNKLFSSNITTGSDKDAEILQNARKNADKDTFLFRIPAPVVIEHGKDTPSVRAAFELQGSSLKVNVSNLRAGSYPLTIDPSIFVVTAEQFMAGNNETNIDFDVSNKLIKKGRTTGARFDKWTSTTSLPATSWGAGTAAAGGYIYSVGGGSFSGQTFSSQGAATFTVPSGITSISVKMWGGGGGGGSGGTSSTGGAGGGAGYVTGSLTVTPNETLNIYVGGGGSAGTKNTTSGGGGGGGHTSLHRSSTALAIAAGGGGGGGGRVNAGQNGANGGAGGGTTGVSGGTFGGGGGGSGSGGSAGSGGSCAGTAGSSLTGGIGGYYNTFSCATGGGGAGGLATGGVGAINGNIFGSPIAGGAGGGAGLFGGGGGGSSSTTSGAGGGGGGSSLVTGSLTSTAGSGASPGNSSDTTRNGAGQGGATSATNGTGNAGTNGIVSITYGVGSSASSQTVNWAKFNTSNGDIDSPNPGNGPCSGWCTTSAYNLPSARANVSMVAYNGFLYAMGGTDSNCTTGNSNGNSGICNTVYIAKLGANGEPRLWHPTDNNPNNWAYWHADTSLSSERAFSSAVAYNNRMYLLGGRTASGAVTTVQVADIKPMGTLGSWTSSTALPAANAFASSAVVYNDRLYVVGGASSATSATATNTYAYTKINSDGTLNSWITSGNTAFTTGRMAYGGTMAVVLGAYIYVSGGCGAVNASGYCTTTVSDTQLASINADGSLDVWNTVGGITNTRIGHGLVAWRDRIYNVGGCTAQNTSTGDCAGGTLANIDYSNNDANIGVNRDGDASTVGQSAASGVGACSGVSPVGCDLPGTAQVGNMLNAAVIVNGYLYVIGGCTNNTCSTTSSNVVYVAISSTGVMSKPAVCTGGTYQGQAWCKSPNTVAGGIAASSPVVFNGTIYLVGGLDGFANTNDIFRATVNTDGSTSTWTSQTMTGVGATSVSYLYANARANPSSAGTNPGNLYIFGGCTASNSAGCTAYTGNVYKCNIDTTGAVGGCTTTGQLQIGIIPGDSSAGLAIMSGTVYANYIYLIGGVSPNIQDLDTVRYAKFDNNNNVVTVGSGWVQSSNIMNTGRRRSAAFGYNGYLYVVGGYEAAAGVLPDIEFIKINVSDGSLVSDATNKFFVSKVQINQRWGLSVPVSNSFAYVIGGCTVGASPSGCSTRTDVIQTFQLYNNDSGAPASYTAGANNLSVTNIGASSTILNGYIYQAGGCTDIGCTTVTSATRYAPIGVDGTIGTWVAGGALPANRTWGKLLAAGGTLYYVGGQTGAAATTAVGTVYYTSGISSGSPTWNGTAASQGIGNTGSGDQARTQFGATVWNNRIYVAGGYNSSGTVQSTVYASPQLNSGGNITSNWTSSSTSPSNTSFNVARSGLSLVAYANNLYLLGGSDGTNYLSDVQYAQINSTNGSVGSWTYSTSLPGPISQGDAFAANGYIYLVGGRSATSTCDPSMLVAPISANTTIASGNSPTGVGAWFETNQRYNGSRYGNSVAYADGKAYVLGGGCAALTSTTDWAQSTTLLSQPQLAKYSIMIDTDSDVFPTHWLLNGLDNSVGARWQLKYRSMTDPTAVSGSGGANGTNCSASAMTTWGQDTSFGNVTLGLPGVYIPKDGSGNNTSCTRYTYFNVTVDSTQAFGYPDDVSRGPTITDLTLNFTADPAKRLMHGRTFTGGLQQPIDTPFYAN